MPHFSRRSKLRVDSKENAVVKAAHVPEQWEPIFRQGVLSENYIRTGPAPHGDHYRQTLFDCAIDYCAGRPTIWRRGTTPLASQRDDQLPCHPAISVLTRSGARKLTTQPHVAIAMVAPFRRLDRGSLPCKGNGRGKLWFIVCLVRTADGLREPATPASLEYREPNPERA